MTTTTTTTKLATITETHTATKVAQTFATIEGKRYEMTTWKAGRVEVYQEYQDQPGLFQFLGYYQEMPMLPPVLGAALHEVYEAHQAQIQDFWTTYLPTAQKWLEA